MTSTSWICTPAGVSGPGALVLRPAAGAVPAARLRHAVVRSVPPFELTGTATAAPVAPVRETGLPIVAPVTDPSGTGGLQHITSERITTERITTTCSTLGIHSPGRPPS